MKQLWRYLWFIGVCIGGVVSAQLLRIDNYSGDVWSRPALTGDWGGLRNTLAKKGISPKEEGEESCTGYDCQGVRVANPLNRYAIGGCDELKYVRMIRFLKTAG